MMILRQSTSVVIPFGPFVAPSDGVTLVTTLVSALDHASTGIFLNKNGGAGAVRHATVTATTYDAYGNYLVTLDTTDTATLGRLRVVFAAAASCAPVWRDFFIVAANVYDSSFVGDGTQFGIMSMGTLAGSGSTTAFTLPAGQRANVSVGDILIVPTIGKKRILTYNATTGAGTTAAFASDTSSTAYVVAAAPANTVLTSADVDATLLANDTALAAVKAKTDNLPADPADASDVSAQIGDIAITGGSASSAQGRYPDGTRSPTS